MSRRQRLLHEDEVETLFIMAFSKLPARNAFDKAACGCGTSLQKTRPRWREQGQGEGYLAPTSAYVLSAGISVAMPSAGSLLCRRKRWSRGPGHFATRVRGRAQSSSGQSSASKEGIIGFFPGKANILIETMRYSISLLIGFLGIYASVRRLPKYALRVFLFKPVPAEHFFVVALSLKMCTHIELC